MSHNDNNLTKTTSSEENSLTTTKILHSQAYILYLVFYNTMYWPWKKLSSLKKIQSKVWMIIQQKLFKILARLLKPYLKPNIILLQTQLPTMICKTSKNLKIYQTKPIDWKVFWWLNKNKTYCAASLNITIRFGCSL